MKALEAARRGHDDVAVAAHETEVVEAGGELFTRDLRAARGEREQPRAGALGQPGRLEAARRAAPGPGP